MYENILKGNIKVNNYLLIHQQKERQIKQERHYQLRGKCMKILWIKNTMEIIRAFWNEKT